MNRKLLIFFDKTVFRAIFYCVVLVDKVFSRHPTAPTGLKHPSRLLIIRPGGIGDGLMTVPLFRAVRETFPSAHVTLLCVKKNQPVLGLMPFFDELIVLDHPLHLVSNLWRLRRRKHDVVLDLEPFRRTSAIVGCLSGAKSRVGFDTNSRRHLYSHLVTYRGDSCFEALNLLHLLRVFGVQASSEQAADMSFPLPEGTRETAAILLDELGIDSVVHKVVAVAPGALKPHHRWIPHRFAKLIDLIRNDDDRVHVVLVGSKGDRVDAEEVLACLGDSARVHDLTGRTDLKGALGLLQMCRVLIASDGGIVPMAASVGCPSVSLWGPGVMDRFKPPGGQHVGVRKDYACVPCVTWDRLGEFPPCPYGRRCYADIESEEVFHAYMRAVGLDAPECDDGSDEGFDQD